jgi:hypothetical protein
MEQFLFNGNEVNTQEKRIEAAAHLKGEILRLKSMIAVQELKLKKLLKDCDHTGVPTQVFDGTEFCGLCERVVREGVPMTTPRHPYDRDFPEED